MKRIAIALAAAALLAPALVLAQDITIDTQDAYVLDKARAEFNEGVDAKSPESGQAGIIEPPEAAGGTPAAAAEPSGRVFVPIVLQWVPGVGAPMGIYDTSLAGGALGSLVGSVDGIQVSSIFSLAEASVKGLQASGVFNISGGSVEGFQGSGVFNIAGASVEGFQGSGVFNIASGRVDGFQGAGVFNIASGRVDGFQGAGVFNIASGRVDGFQGAGVFNIAEELDGVQAAGIINIAGKARGLMLAPINIADSLDGLAIGILNFIGDGINEVGVEYAPDLDLVSAVWRNGTRSLFWLLRLSAPAEDLDSDWDQRLAISLGLGTRLRLGRESWIDLDISGERSYDADFRAEARAAFEEEDCRALWEAFAPYPSIGLNAGSSFGPLSAWVGIRADVDLPGLVETSARWREGDTITWSGSIWDFDYVIRPRLVFGVAY